MIRSTWRGGRARFNAPDLKSGEGSNLPGVRIPPSPPSSKNPHIVAGFFMGKRKPNEYLSIRQALETRTLLRFFCLK